MAQKRQRDSEDCQAIALDVECSFREFDHSSSTPVADRLKKRSRTMESAVQLVNSFLKKHEWDTIAVNLKDVQQRVAEAGEWSLDECDIGDCDSEEEVWCAIRMNKTPVE